MEYLERYIEENNNHQDRLLLAHVYQERATFDDELEYIKKSENIYKDVCKYKDVENDRLAFIEASYKYSLFKKKTKTE